MSVKKKQPKVKEAGSYIDLAQLPRTVKTGFWVALYIHFWLGSVLFLGW